MCVCMYVCVYIYIHTYICIRYYNMHVYGHMRSNIHAYILIGVHVRIQLGLCMYDKVLARRFHHQVGTVLETFGARKDSPLSLFVPSSWSGCTEIYCTVIGCAWRQRAKCVACCSMLPLAVVGSLAMNLCACMRANPEQNACYLVSCVWCVTSDWCACKEFTSFYFSLWCSAFVLRDSGSVRAARG